MSAFLELIDCFLWTQQLCIRSLCVQISDMFLQKHGVLKMTFKKKCVYNIRQLILVSEKRLMLYIVLVDRYVDLHSEGQIDWKGDI